MSARKVKPYIHRFNQGYLKGLESLGYGSNPKKYKDPLLPRFKVLIYDKGIYHVIDRYTGHSKYAGQAITYYRNQPLFALNYYGAVLAKPLIDINKIFKFLKGALRANSKKNLYRGMNGFRKGRFTYRNQSVSRKGIVEGKEKIFSGRRLIYVAVYHGGYIYDNRPDAVWSKNLLTSSTLLKAFQPKKYCKRLS